MNKWITKTFHLGSLDGSARDTSLLMLQVMLLASPPCLLAGLLHIAGGRLGLGAVIAVEGLAFAAALWWWAAGHNFTARIGAFFTIGTCAGIQNTIIPLESGYLMLFPLLISMSYIMFFKDESKLRIGGALYMIAVTIGSFFLRFKGPKVAALPADELLFTQISTLLGINLATLFIVRYYVQRGEQREREIVQAHKLIEEARVKNLGSIRIAMLGDMAGGIAHEILNPLTVINGSAFVIDSHSADREKIAAQVVKIRRMVKRITGIVDGLFAFTGEMKDSTPMQNFVLFDAIEQAAQFFTAKMDNLGIQLILEVPREPIEILGKKSEITEVVISILSNAIDAVSLLPEPWIKVFATASEREVCVNFVDAGTGIPDEIAVKIMEPFFTTKEVGRGAGLGLSISRGICLAHGGRLELAGNEKNTKFMMFLPRAAG